ncbi:uncharacterized protein LOC120986584 isoform X1 [Bufo bufo]|uniref:uncharacterized protein LOC120986584 isoform X1 n=1 Tax=Bufo bufo TaxID=8384 RepID=UPI001ABE46FD|nr:uncharacterized protein LOC120986584 isoform X1 [Bufo bufo]
MPSHSSRVDSLVPVTLPQPEVAAPNPVSEQIPSTSGVSVPSPGGRSGRQGVPAAPMAPGGRQLMPLIQASVSPATWQAHGKAWGDWESMVGGRDVASSDDLRLEVTVKWLLQLRASGVSASMAQRRLSGVAFHFKLRDWPDVTRRFIIRQALRGWRKELVYRECRRPVSFNLLGRLIAKLSDVCRSLFEVALFSASFSIAFFAALRIGELVAPSGSRPGGLSCADVVLGNGALRIRVSRSKTDQFGSGSWIPLHPVPGVSCPVRLTSSYSSMRGPGHNFLAHADGSPLTKFQFTSVFKSCLELSGMNPREFGTHSFRIGAATEAAKAGLPESEVMRIGRWKSACFARYIRPDLL